MMKHIRPHQVFDLVSAAKERMSYFLLPNKYSATLTIESAILISLIKIMRPARLFEFGTYLGEQTLNMAANIPDDGVVYTLDLDLKSFEEAALHDADFPIAKKQLELPKVFADTPFNKRIKCLYGDSTKFNFYPFRGSFEFILIDGGHDLKTVDSDTKNAINMLSLRDPCCILWHDYLNPNYQITDYLDNLSIDLDLFHVEETKYVFYLRNVQLDIISSLT